MKLWRGTIKVKLFELIKRNEYFKNKMNKKDGTMHKTNVQNLYNTNELIK